MNNGIPENQVALANGWRTLGSYFGYPKCCTEALIDALIKGWESSLTQDSIFDGTGYRPCRVCEDKGEEYMLKSIATNRICPTPFPESNI